MILDTQEGDTNTVILRALEEYVTAARKCGGRQRRGKYLKVVKALSTAVAALNLSARPASSLRTLKIKYVYELVHTTPRDLFGLPNFDEKSLREVNEKLAALGLTLGMTPDDEAYRTAGVATVAANVRTRRG